jgi:5-methylcytosine-specific restriction endonuclease McrBC GTP-binding regulatory subunit McrB
MKELIELLKFQGQLILQGAPGTGKTYLAKQIAEKLVFESIEKNIDSELEKRWKEFVDWIDGKELEIKKGNKFFVRKDSSHNLTIDKEEITITKDNVKTILQKAFNDLDNYDPNGTTEGYSLEVAKAFKNWLCDKYMKIVQFHPSYTYEDFVRGIKLEVDNDTKTPKYKAVDKIFAEFCKKANEDRDKTFVLIIDEINRANLPVVLGELIYALEYRGEEVETPYEVDNDRKLKVPENLYIIGTMNTADRSIGHIDYAIRRRFVFVDIKPDKDAIKHVGAKKLYENFIEELFKPENLSSEFRSNINDVKIGHSYFIVKEEEINRLKSYPEEEAKIKVLTYKFFYQVIPLLREYIKDGVLLEAKVEEVTKKVFGKGLDQLNLENIERDIGKYSRG